MNKFAVFDIDGTLIRWQLYHAIANKLAKEGVLSKDVQKQIQESRMRWKRREYEEAFHDYEAKLIELFQSSLKTIEPKLLDKAVEEVADEYKSQVYVYTRALAKDLKSRGYKLIAISGSHDEIVGHIARNYGFDIWVGSRYDRNEKGFSGKTYVASKHKKEILEDLIKKHNLILEDSYAIGDTANDSPMLEMVENPIAFNPNKVLYEIAKEKGWKIVVERKNVCYELIKSPSGEYLLS